MKRLVTFVIALVFILGTVGCSNNLLHTIKKAAKIEIVHYERHSSDEEPRTAIITNEDCIKHICDNLNSLKLKKIEYGEPMMLEFKLIFYDADLNVIGTVYIPFHNGMDFGGDYYTIIDGEIDRDYIAALL